MTQIETTSRLSTIMRGSDLAPESMQQLEALFHPLMERADALVASSAGIVVTDATQVSEMKKARSARLALKETRVSIENARKMMKADALSRGRLIDAIAKALTAPIEPEEARLEDCEKFAERAEAARQESLRVARTEALAPYGIDASIFPLGTMKEDAFGQLLDGTRLAFEARIEAARKAEAEEAARKEAEIAERARIKAENDRLRAEAEAREAAAKVEREKAARERAEIEAKARKEREAAEAAARAEKAKADEALRREREAREAAEAKVKAEVAAKAKAEADAAKAAKKAAAAPDAEKLRLLADQFRKIVMPRMASVEGEAAVVRILAWRDKLAGLIENEAGAL